MYILIHPIELKTLDKIKGEIKGFTATHTTFRSRRLSSTFRQRTFINN